MITFTPLSARTLAVSFPMPFVAPVFHQIKFVFNLFFREGKMMHLMNQFVATEFGLTNLRTLYLTWSESHSNTFDRLLHDAQRQRATGNRKHSTA
jgi:hypothetical protein